MTKFIERVIHIFGDRTPGHKVKVSVQEGIPTIEMRIEPLKNPVSVRYAPGTEIRIDPDKDYRPFGEEEVIFARDIQFFGAGMSNGYTTDGRYFKALDDPIEITPLTVLKEGTK